MNETIYFDIETGALPKDDMLPFDPKTVKLGNLKDEAKIEVKLAKAKEEYGQENCALSWRTGRVLAVGIENDGFPLIIDHRDEGEILEEFWDIVHPNRQLVGFNIKRFDLPFLFMRSLILGVTPRMPIYRGRIDDTRLIDIYEIYQNIHGESISLNRLANICGLKEKEFDGSQFQKLWLEDRDKAIEYITYDVELVKAIATKMGVV